MFTTSYGSERNVEVQLRYGAKREKGARRKKTCRGEAGTYFFSLSFCFCLCRLCLCVYLCVCVHKFDGY